MTPAVTLLPEHHPVNLHRLRAQVLATAPAFIGEANPAPDLPPLFPGGAERGKSADRLVSLLALTPSLLLRCPRHNLFPTPPTRWDRDEAFARAFELHPELPPRVVLLGRRVAAAFRLADASPFTLHRTRNRSYLLLPHPSGRNTAWNNPCAAVTARDLLLRLVTS